MKKLHLFAHMKWNKVKVGDRVKKYETVIGTVGTGEGQYYAHLHFSISESLSIKQLEAYVQNWSRADVENSYRDPRGIDFNKMFGRKMDVGKAGYDWLQPIHGGGFHPGVDVNGPGGGNTDLGWAFKSSCNGVVIYDKRTEKADGWGNIVIVEADEEVNVCEEEKKQFQKEINELNGEISMLRNSIKEDTKKILEQSENIKRLENKLTEQSAEIEKLNQVKDKGVQALGVIRLLQEAFKLIINFK